MIRGESQCHRPSVAPRPPRPAGCSAGGAARLQTGCVLACWPDRHADSCLQIEPAQSTFLQLGVDNRRIVRIHAGLESVAAADAVPIARPNARAVERPRRPADRSVVLRAAANVVERPRVVRGHAIELRERQVGEVPPRLHAIVGLVEAAVVPDDDVIPIARVEHNLVVVDVHAGHWHCGPGLPAVRASGEVRPGRPDRLGVVAVDEDLVVVARIAASVAVVGRSSTSTGLRRRPAARRPPEAAPADGDTLAVAGGGRRWRRTQRHAYVRNRLRYGRGARGRDAATPAGVVGGHRPPDPRPRRAGIVRSEETALIVLSGHEGVHGVGVLPVDPEADAADIHGRQTLGQLRPALPAIGRLVQPAFRTASNELPDLSAALIGGRVDDLRLPGIHHHVRDACIGAHRQHGLPRLTAIGGLEQTAVSA